MIKNERQYKITRAAFERFKGAIARLDKESGPSPDRLVRLERDALHNKMLDLQEELDEYDRLKREKTPIMEILDIDDLPKALIKYRIALGLTQRELAEKLGLKEQQIQRYEHTDYESASLSRVREVFHALDSERRAQIPDSQYQLKHLFKRLGAVGLDRDFVTQRLAPEFVTQRLDPEFAIDDNIPEEISAFQIASRVGRVFRWSTGQILGDEPLVVGPVQVKFKIPQRHNTQKLHPHSGYVHYIARLLSKATAHITKAAPSGPSAVREALPAPDQISFRDVLEYVWGTGTPVISIDSLSFHAACIKGDADRSVIILAQKTRSEARLIFNLLHELYHVMANEERIEFDLYESAGGEEQEASRFAHEVLLKDGDDLYNTCIGRCSGDDLNLAFLKRVVEELAEERTVRADVLANYMAYRLSERGANWWGAAQNMQRPPDKTVARNAVLDNVDFGLLAVPDQDLLMQALRID